MGKKMYREKTKIIKIGDRYIGGGNPILIQSMTNTKTEDVEATVAQILALEKAGFERIKVHNKRYFKGLRLRADDSADEDFLN